MRIERVSRTGVSVTITDVKAFANISTTADDVMLQRLLNSAMNKVEEVANVSLSVNTLKYYSEKKVNEITLSLPPITSVTSVIDVELGTAVPYTKIDNRLKLDLLSDVVVTYVTSAQDNDELEQLVIEVTSLMYDGEDYEKTLQKIPRL